MRPVGDEKISDPAGAPETNTYFSGLNYQVNYSEIKEISLGVGPPIRKYVETMEAKCAKCGKIEAKCVASDTSDVNQSNKS